MAKRIFALLFIFGCTSAAWFILAGTMTLRTDSQDSALSEDVSNLWGKPQIQMAPNVSCLTSELDTTPILFDQNRINVNFDLEHRKKGLLWYSTYIVQFEGEYRFTNPTGSTREFLFSYAFPYAEGIYDSFNLSINGETVGDVALDKGAVVRRVSLGSGQSATVHVGYRSQGLDTWSYEFGKGVTQIKGFTLTMTSNFREINFPDNSMSPTQKTETADGWKLVWHYDSLVSGSQIALEMPKRLNPGPFVARVSSFAPVSLFLFFFVLFIITAIKEINIHPMNYFFLAAAFFAFHLLLAYLVDHIEINIAMAISTTVSIFLVISYMRLVAGIKFALLQVGVSQFVFLVLFSYAFFLEGFTGLAITICCILTLAFVMLTTGRFDWEKRFAATNNRAVPPVFGSSIKNE